MRKRIFVPIGDTGSIEFIRGHGRIGPELLLRSERVSDPIQLHLTEDQRCHLIDVLQELEPPREVPETKLSKIFREDPAPESMPDDEFEHTAPR